MTKEIVRTKTSKNAETLMAVYIYIYIYRYSYKQVEFAYSTTHTFSTEMCNLPCKKYNVRIHLFK